MNKATKTILNSLRCPVCLGQVDLIDYMAPKAKSTSYNFGCAVHYEHYKLWFPHWDSNQIGYDMVKVYEGRYLHIIMQRYPITQTSISTQSVDAEGSLIDTLPAKTFAYNKILFDWSKTNPAKIINKVKTILTFQ
jgi:hypothetical protein